jgi:hypothetical protein
MQSSDLTKFKFAANIAGPYCSACCAGGGSAGAAGPTGPTGPMGGLTGPTGPTGAAGTAPNWSEYPAIQNVDMSCNLINDLSAINFCDGTYIGPGGSFDISSNDNIVIKSVQDTEIRHYNAGDNSLETIVSVNMGGKLSIAGGNNGINIGGIRFEGGGGKGGDLYADEGTASVQFIAGGGLAINMESATAVSVATSAPDTVVQLLANGGSGSLTVSDVGTNGYISMSANQIDAVVSGGTIALDSDVAVAIKNSAGEPVLRFENPSASGFVNADMVYQATGNYTITGPALITNAPEFGVSEGGAGLGSVRIGTTGTENYIVGGGLPLKIANKVSDITDASGKRIEFEGDNIIINNSVGQINIGDIANYNNGTHINIDISNGAIDISGTLNLNCSLINDLSAINFCDGTYIGPGGSFDISSNQNIVIKSTNSVYLNSTSDTIATVQSFFVKDKDNVADGIELHPFDDGSFATSIRGLNDVRPLQIAQSSSSENNDRLRFDVGGSGTELKGTVLTMRGSSALTAQSDSSLYVTAAAGVSITANGGQLALTANFEGNAGAGDIAIAGRTAFNFDGRQFATSDLNKGEQIASNNAYVPMTWYKNDISFTIDATHTLAFDGPDFIWRYSGIFGPAGLTSESAFCSSKRVQVDVSVAAEDFNDDVVWWVVLRDDTNATDYNARDFINERFGFINVRQTNPSNGLKNQTFSFSTVFDMASTGSPPNDGDTCKFRLFGYGTTTTTTPRAQVSLTVRPLREF